MALPKISPIQAAFVHAYLETLNATDAVKRAGYKCKNDKVASVQGARLLANAKIQAAIQEARKAREAKSLITIEWVLSQIAAIAQNEEERAADRLKALELIGKHLGMFERREEAEDRSVKVTFEAEMEAWSE